MAETTPQLFSQQVPKSPEKVSRLSQPGSLQQRFSRLGVAFVMAILLLLQSTSQSHAQGATNTQTIRLDEIGGIDSYVRSSVPGQSFSEAVLQTGGWGDTYRTFIKFPVSSFPANYTKVRLAIFCYDNNASIGGQNVGLTLLSPNAAWDQNITWQNQPALSVIQSLPGTPAVGQWLEIDLTTQIQAWIAGQPNNGVALDPVGINNQWNKFHSTRAADVNLRPRLLFDVPASSSGSTNSQTIRLENIAAVDSYVNSIASSTAFGTKSETRTGGSLQDNRLLIQFPTVGFPSAVTKATLYMYCKGSNQASAGNAPQNLYVPSTSWTNAVTWNSKPAASLVSAVPRTPVAGQWTPIEITSQLSGWLAGGINNGIELRSSGVANQENVFASLESSIATERPYLVVEYAPTTALGVGLTDEFGGVSLNSTAWAGSATVAGGIASISSEIRMRNSFQIGNTTRVELRMRRISSPHVWAGLAEVSPGTASIDFGDNPYAGGMALAIHGPFGENAVWTGTPTTDWQEYRVTISGNSVVLARGSTLANLTETITQPLQATAAGRSMTFGINPYGTAEIDWVRISDPFSIEGIIEFPGGRPGKVNLVSGASSHVAPALGIYKMQVFNGSQQVLAFLDENENGFREPWEAVGKYTGPALNITGPTLGINITLALPADADHDGMSDEWELANGLNSAVNDAQGDLDGDGLSNISEYRLLTQVAASDSDGDGINDGPEIAAGTNPLLADTDGDGMDDAWEITFGLNPLINDALGDLDLDGLTNKEEYDLRATGYRPNAWNSKGTSGDYRSLKGEGWVRRGYDKLDRLISTEKENGFAQLYGYDGNSNKKKDVVLTSLDTDGDSLPDAWEFTNSLSYSGAGAASGDNGASGDPDHDGFTNLQEWKAGTDPRYAGSQPGTGAISLGNMMAAAPGSWVMATGQLDGFGGDEVVAGSDGTYGSSTNLFSVFQKTGNKWAVKSTYIGIVDINSLAIGEATAGRGPSIFFGAWTASGATEIQEYRRSGTTWLKSASPVAASTGAAIAQVISVNSAGVLGLLSPASQAAGGIFRTSLASDIWSTPAVVSSNAGKRSWPTPVLSGAARWLDAGGIEINAGSPPVALGAIKNPVTGSWYFLTPSPMTWPNAELYATQNGGHLVTVNDAAEQQWIQSNFPSQNMWIGLFRGSNGDGWQWVSGASANYRNWYPGEPNNAGGNEPYGNITTAWTWNDSNNPGLIGLIEISASSASLQTLPDPPATSKLISRGRSLASGQLRTGINSGTSLVYAFIDDKDTSGTVNSGDTFVLGEHELAAANPVQRTAVALPISSSISSIAIGLTVLKIQGALPRSVLAVGEPDGTVSLWSAPDVGSPLIRKVISTEFKGKSWHQMEVLHEANGSEGLVGLLADPATPHLSQLIYWTPESIEAALNGTAPILNNLPFARVLTTPAQGGPYSAVGVRIWDAEAHGSSLELQYQRDGETTWNNATVATVDGTNFQPTLKLNSQPTGISHTLVWNATTNLGSTFSGTVLLRTRATDSQTGDWSPAMPYSVLTNTTLDTDNDGMPDSWESTYGLNPIVADGTSDNDRDGVLAFLEYALAMNPTVPDVPLLPRLGTLTEADGKHLTLTYQRPKNSGITYTAQRSVTLASTSWLSGTANFTELTPVDLGNGTESVTVKDLNAMSASSRAWLRLKVSK